MQLSAAPWQLRMKAFFCMWPDSTLMRMMGQQVSFSAIRCSTAPFDLLSWQCQNSFGLCGCSLRVCTGGIRGSCLLALCIRVRPENFSYYEVGQGATLDWQRLSRAQWRANTFTRTRAFGKRCLHLMRRWSSRPAKPSALRLVSEFNVFGSRSGTRHAR